MEYATGTAIIKQMSVEITAVITDSRIAYQISSENRHMTSISGDENRIRPKNTAIRTITTMSEVPIQIA
jgi:hypothetical protein